MFQSTLPRRERRFIRKIWEQQQKKFQSTLPRRERPESLRMLPNPFGFNPRSREGSDDIPAPRLLPEGRFNPRSREGSDKNEIEEVEDFIVSIHAPAKGATESFWIQSCRSSVSIHAPAKGATNEFGDIKPKTIGFNPRSREGSDLTRTSSGTR